MFDQSFSRIQKDETFRIHWKSPLFEGPASGHQLEVVALERSPSHKRITRCGRHFISAAYSYMSQAGCYCLKSAPSLHPKTQIQTTQSLPPTQTGYPPLKSVSVIPIDFLFRNHIWNRLQNRYIGCIEFLQELKVVGF